MATKTIETKQQCNGERKGLWLKLRGHETEEDIIAMAKAEAVKIGFNQKEYLRVLRIQRYPELNGASVVVQSLW